MMTLGAWLIILLSIQVFLASGDIDIRVDNVRTSTEDEYVCSDVKLRDSKPVYPIGFETHSEQDIAHHILLYACSEPKISEMNCMDVCPSNQKILYAWARNAKPLRLPKDVSFEIGGHTDYRYLVLQVHYKKRISTPDNSGVTVYTVSNPLPNVAGVLLMAANWATIRSQKKAVPVGMACMLSMTAAITPFAVRVHAHDLARTNFAYWFPRGGLDKPQLVGRGSPQWPQAFYPSELHKPMQKGDYLVGFCVYDSMKRHRDTYIGATHKDEMCNVYIMYYRRREDPALTENDELACAGGIQIAADKFSRLVQRIPHTAFDYLPTKLSSYTETRKPTKLSSYTETRKPTVAVTENPEPTVAVTEKRGPVAPSKEPVVHDVKLKVQARLGQVAGVAVDSKGRLFIFHRGDRKWDGGTFDLQDRYRNADERGPIKDATVLVVDRASGAVLQSFGAGLFFLPHGISIDAADNVWLTDVALHQVFRFDKHNFSSPALTLGVRLTPGADNTHFCKPTDVAVQSNGNFFVADGYCNARIVAFSPQGRFLRSWGSASGQLEVPHSLALVNDSLLCCADRERARVECFRTADGESLLTVLDQAPFGEQLFAICKAPAFSRHSPALYGVSFRDNAAPQAFLLDLTGRRVLVQWDLPPGRPHDVASFGVDVLVSNLDDPVGVFRFQIAGPTAQLVNATLSSHAVGPVVLTAAPHNVSQLAATPWKELKEKLPIVLAVVLLVPLGVIGLGAVIARLHRARLRSRSKAYKEHERAQFKALINEDESGSDGEMTLMGESNLYKYGLPRPTPSPRNT